MNRFAEISQYRKSFDIITNWVYYPIATYLCALLSHTAITPNFITAISIFLELSAVCMIVFDFENSVLLITLLLQLGYVFDLMDGMLARYKKIGFYHPEKPSLTGYYLDAVSDHVLRFLILGSLVFAYASSVEEGWYLGLFFIVMYGILQTEHTIRQLITVGKSSSKTTINSNKLGQVALLHNNIYLFYLIFIPIVRLDLFFIIYSIGGVILFLKRIFKFWLGEK